MISVRESTFVKNAAIHELTYRAKKAVNTVGRMSQRSSRGRLHFGELGDRGRDTQRGGRGILKTPGGSRIAHQVGDWLGIGFQLWKEGFFTLLGNLNEIVQ